MIKIHQFMKNNIIKNNMEHNEAEMRSLYEYLGRAAGPELGHLVARAAVQAKVPITKHHVENTKYTGEILRYPKAFLDIYFGKVVAGNSTSFIDDLDDDLPF